MKFVKVVAKRPHNSKTIADLKPHAERYEVKIESSPGLRLRVTPNGVKTFRRSIGGGDSLKWVTLGEFTQTPRAGALTLAQAMEWSEKLGAAQRQGQLDAALLELERVMRPAPAKAEDGALTVNQVAESFMATMRRVRKRPEQAEFPLKKDILPAIGERLIASVKTQDGARIIEAVSLGHPPREKPAPRQAGVVRAILTQLFKFAYETGKVEVNVMDRLTNLEALGIVSNVSQRVLSDVEMREFWHGLDKHISTPTIRHGLKVLLLTGVRSGELLKARLEHVDLEGRTWTIPVEHQKLTKTAEKRVKQRAGGGHFVVPLAPVAVGLFEELAALARAFGSQYLMATFSPKGEGGPLTDKSLIHAMRRLYSPVGMAPLKFEGERPTPHDLRRTLRTGLNKLGVPHEVAEKCLNHSLGKIAETYAVTDLFDQRRLALEKWADHVKRLIS